MYKKYKKIHHKLLFILFPSISKTPKNDVPKVICIWDPNTQIKSEHHKTQYSIRY